MCENLYNGLYVPTVVACTKLYKASLFKGVRFPKGWFHEDEATTYKLLYKSQRTGVTTQVLYGYRINPKSITKSAQCLARRKFHLLALNERKEFFKSEGQKKLFALTINMIGHAWRWDSTFPIEERRVMIKNFRKHYPRILFNIRTPVLDKLFFALYCIFPTFAESVLKRIKNTSH